MQRSNVRRATRKSPTPPLAIYRDRPLRWRDLFLIFIPGALAVLAPFFYGLQRYLYGRAHYGPVAAQTWSQPWFALAAVALIPLIVLALRRVRRARRLVILYKQGLGVRWTGGQSHKLLWREIDGLIYNTVENTFLGIPLKTRNRLTILNQSGKSIHIDDRIPELAELTARVKARVYPRLLPQFRAAFQNGDPLYFGPITLHKKQLKFREQEIPWEQVTRLNVVKGLLVVESESSRRIKVAIGKIPNADLLIQLLQEGVQP